MTLVANMGSALHLMRYKDGDANVRSAQQILRQAWVEYLQGEAAL